MIYITFPRFTLAFQQSCDLNLGLSCKYYFLNLSADC